jgi:hypothetical protein
MSDLPQNEKLASSLHDWDHTTPEPPTGPGIPWASPGAPPWGSLTQDIGHTPKKPLPAWAVVLIVLGLIFVLCSFTALGLVGGANKDETAQPAAVVVVQESQKLTQTPGHIPAAPAVGTKVTAKVTTVPAPPGVGTTFRVADFQYTIHAVKTGISKVGGAYTQERAQGAFTRLDITVKNVSDGPEFFDTDLRLKVEDATGRRFSSSSGANIFGNEGQDGWFTEINPGNAIRAYAFFDLPKGAKATRLLVSAGIFTLKKDAIVQLS